MSRIRFCSTSDKVNIAFAESGFGPVLVKTPNWMNHVEMDLTSPIWARWIETASRSHRLIRYDARGCGLSDRDVDGLTFDTNKLDLDAVVNAAGIDRFALFGASQGAAIAIEYAALHPDRVSHLILYGGYLKGALRRSTKPEDIDEARTMLKLVELGWGRENSAFRQVFATQFIPDSTLEQLHAFDRIQQQTVSPITAAQLLRTFFDVDVTALAAEVRCPTLVMHSRGDARIPFEAGRAIASAIPGAEFLPLESRNHILLDHQPAWQQSFDEIRAFFERHGASISRGGEGTIQALTPGERRVLELIASGFDNSQIAQALSISVKTVRNHINSIFSKLAVPDRGKAIVLARHAGLGQQGGAGDAVAAR